MPEERPKPDNQALRIKDEHKTHEDNVYGFSDNTQGFYTELSVIFPELRVTSGRRDSSPSGNFSHHHNGDALDLGKEHTDVYEYLNNTREGLNLMVKYGMGILDETNPESMEKTKATGPHFHIGQDSGLSQKSLQRYEQFENIQPIQSFYSQNPNFDYSKPTETKDANFNLQGSYKPEVKIPIEGINPDGTTFNLVLPNNQVAQTFMGEIDKEKDKEDIKATNIAVSPDRQLLERKKQEEAAKVEQVFSTMKQVRNRDVNSATRKSSSIHQASQSQPQFLDIPQSLPKLPSIFNV